MQDERPADAGGENDDAAHWHIVEFVPLPTDAPPSQPSPPAAHGSAGGRTGRSRPSDGLGQRVPRPPGRTMPPPGQVTPTRPPVANSRPIFNDLDNLLRGVAQPPAPTQNGASPARPLGPGSFPPLPDPASGVSPSQPSSPFGAPERASTVRRFKDGEGIDESPSGFLSVRRQFNRTHAQRRRARLRLWAIVLVCAVLVALALWWSSPHWLSLLARLHIHLPFHVPGLN